jgi:acetylornithine deacetylase/succinyl-diaminopimelate desuccinylase-like protein
MTKKDRELSMSRDQFMHDLGELVGFPTITGQPEGFREAMLFVQEQISSQAQVELLENNGEPILLASNQAGKTPDVCYLVHVDVVNANPEQFSARMEEGKSL